MGYLAAQKASASGESVAVWEELDNLCKKKLWHQLTVFLEAHLHSAVFQAGGLVALYENFISKFEDRINSLSLVRILSAVAKQQPTPQASIVFLSRFKDKTKKTDLAYVLLLSTIAEFALVVGDLKAAKEIIEQAAPVIEAVDGVSPVHSAFYRVSASLSKSKGDFAAYYLDALRFLGCTDLASIPKEEQQQWAFDLGIATLLGDKIYNFGELLSHPVLVSLQDTDRAWLVKLLGAFNSGDAGTVDALRGVWAQNANLSANLPVLQEKLKLLSLMELVYRAPAHHRALPFASVAQACNVPVNEVEVLVMRGLSRGLVKGTVDGVEQIAHLHWVQPRVLDHKQLAQMHSNLLAWVATVRTASEQVRAHAAELLVE